MKLKIIGILLLTVSLTACNEYNKLLKSTDPVKQYEAAKRYYDEGKYGRTAALLETAEPLLMATNRSEDAKILRAKAQYALKDYTLAAEYYKNYYTTFPRGKYAEEARYQAAYALYLDSPDPRLDQSQTYAAMQEFQNFLDYYPQSDRKDEVEGILFALQEKLAYKELLSVRLYYNLGDYVLYSFPGGNYLSCVITAQNAMRTYPNTQYREELMYYIFKSKYEIAVQSVKEKKEFRMRDVVDEYYSYKNDYPSGKYLGEITKLYNIIAKQLKS